VETQQSDRAPRTGTEKKMEKAVPKIAGRRDTDEGNPGGELNPAVDNRMLGKKNPSVLSCVDKRTKEGSNCSSEVKTVHRGLRWGSPHYSGETEGIWKNSFFHNVLFC